MDDSRLPLFVFGTLRFGQINHHYLAGRYLRLIPAVLHDYARVNPLMIERQPGAQVAGELYEIFPIQYAQTLAGCDELEGIPPGKLIGHEYERRKVTVQTAAGPVEAWAYVQPERF